MKTSEAIFSHLKHCRFAGLLFLLAAGASANATDLYNLNFTPAETGTYQVTMGSPTIQSAVGSFPDALVFDAVSGGQQIQLPVGAGAPQYDIQFDALAHNLVNSDYAFVAYLDTPDLCTVNLHGGLNTVYAFQSSLSLDFGLAPLVNDSVYHFDVALNTQGQGWSVAVNGTDLFDGPLNGGDLSDIRFGLAPWNAGSSNAPNTWVALDNVVVSAVPEPPAMALAAAGILAWLQFHRRGASRPNGRRA